MPTEMADRDAPCLRPRITLAVAALLGVVVLSGCGRSPGPKGSTAPVGLPDSTRTLNCSASTGVGDGSISPDYLTLGDVAFNGLFPNRSQTLETLPSGLLWDKTYIDVPKTLHQKISISVRPLTSGAIGLNWGTQDVNESPGSASSTSLHVKSLHLDICGGSGGFAGGFVMTKPLCARLSMIAGGDKVSRLVEFGQAECPT
jgi:hypothetical protein